MKLSVFILIALNIFSFSCFADTRITFGGKSMCEVAEDGYVILDGKRVEVEGLSSESCDRARAQAEEQSEDEQRRIRREAEEKSGKDVDR